MPRHIRLINIISVAAIFCIVLIVASAPENKDYGADFKKDSGKKEILLSATITANQPENETDNNILSVFSIAPVIVETSPDNTDVAQPQPEISIPELPTNLTIPANPHRHSEVEHTLTVINTRENTAEKEYREVWAMVTAYCPCYKCCGRGSPGRTSLGKTAWRPGIAADPRAIAYGTKIDITGYGLREVDDTGGAMRQSWSRRGVIHLDIRMTYHWQARSWGRRLMKVKIYDK